MRPATLKSTRQRCRKGGASPYSVRQLLRGSLSLLLPRRLFLTSGSARDGCVFLTFDDGPHPEHTPPLLRMLAELNATATFFVVGQNAASHPKLVREIVERGHSIGHHSFHHRLPNSTSPAQLLHELDCTNAILQPIIGYHPILFRPPYGHLTARKMAALWRRGYSIVLWNTDPRDYACQSRSNLDMWFRDHPCEAGDVVLFHDTYPFAIDVLPDLVEYGTQRGLRFCPIPSLRRAAR